MKEAKTKPTAAWITAVLIFVCVCVVENTNSQSVVVQKDSLATEQLVSAARSGDIETVKSLLKNAADVNAKDTNGITALMGAAVTGQTNVLELLLDKGADINETNTDGSTALNCAAMEGRTDAAELLLDKGADIGNALEKAAWNGSVETIKLFLAKGADVNAVYYGTGTALISAALAGKFEAVKLLLERGADVNAKEATGETALIFAAGSGKTNVVELLLDNGADINANALFDGTALMEAAHDGNIEVVKFLLARGADINAKNSDGQTALDVARKNGNTAIVQLLQPVNLAVASGTNTDSSGYVTNTDLLTPFTLTNSAGDVVTNAVLVKLTPNKFIYKTPDGAEGMLPLKSLPENLRSKFGYDPTYAALADRFETEKKEEIYQQQQIQLEQKSRLDNANKEMTNHVWTLYGRVVQKIDEGLLVSLKMDDYKTQIILLKDYPNESGAAEDDEIKRTVAYQTGNFSYDTVNGSKSTIHVFTCSKNVALEYYLQLGDTP
jgi:ankyrin repeat protein